MKNWSDAPMTSRRGRFGFIALGILVAVIVFAVVATGVSRNTRENIAKATAPWSEDSVVKMELKPLANSNQIEVKIESGCQQEEMKLNTIQTIEEEGTVTAINRSKYFTLPKGETIIRLPVSPNWTKVRVILYHSPSDSDRLVIEAELLREDR